MDNCKSSRNRGEVIGQGQQGLCGLGELIQGRMASGTQISVRQGRWQLAFYFAPNRMDAATKRRQVHLLRQHHLHPQLRQLREGSGILLSGEFRTVD